MPTTASQTRVREILLRDPGWSLYALGDLDPRLAPHAEWHVGGSDGGSVVLVYRGFSPPILFAGGQAAEVTALLDELGPIGAVYLHVKRDVVTEAGSRLRECRIKPMRRMVAGRDTLKWTSHDPGLRRLDARDLGALERLYDDGTVRGERPVFFAASMLEDGVYYGVWRSGELVSAAGTHLVAPREGVAALGNVYTRRDCRGRGFGRCATAAVAAELLNQIALVGLNVEPSNGGAIRVYESLGFAFHCEYCEGPATLFTP